MLTEDAVPKGCHTCEVNCTAPFPKTLAQPSQCPVFAVAKPRGGPGLGHTFMQINHLAAWAARLGLTLVLEWGATDDHKDLRQLLGNASGQHAQAAARCQDRFHLVTDRRSGTVWPGKEATTSPQGVHQ